MLLEMPTKALIDHLADPPSLSAPVNEALAAISAAAPAKAPQAPAAAAQAPDKAPPAAQQAPKAPGEVKVLQRPKASPSDAQARMLSSALRGSVPILSDLSTVIRASSRASITL